MSKAATLLLVLLILSCLAILIVSQINDKHAKDQPAPVETIVVEESDQYELKEKWLSDMHSAAPGCKLAQDGYGFQAGQVEE